MNYILFYLRLTKLECLGNNLSLQNIVQLLLRCMCMCMLHLLSKNIVKWTLLFNSNSSHTAFFLLLYVICPLQVLVLLVLNAYWHVALVSLVVALR